MKKTFDMLVQTEPESDTNNSRLSILLTRVCPSDEIPEDLKVSHKNIIDSGQRNRYIRSIIRLLENSIEE